MSHHTKKISTKVVHMNNRTHCVMDNSGILVFDVNASVEQWLTAFGDLDFHSSVSDYLDTNDAEKLFEGVRSSLLNDSVKVANLETVILKKKRHITSMKAILTCDRKAIDAIKSIGIDSLSFANNHCMDAGAAGLLECIEIVKDNGIALYGSGQNEAKSRTPSIITRNNIKFAMFAYADNIGQIAKKGSPGCAEVNFRKIAKDIAPFTRLKGTIVVISLHMDAEFQNSPAPDRVRLCRNLSDLGADIILCHHPHVPQGIERWNDSLIIYSLGNFVTPISEYMLKNSNICDYSFYVDIGVNLRGVCRAQINPVRIDDFGRPIISKGPYKKEILQILEDRSLVLKNMKAVKKNYHTMTRQYLKRTISTIIWAVINRDPVIIKNVLLELVKTPVKRKWIVHSLKHS